MNIERDAIFTAAGLMRSAAQLMQEIMRLGNKSELYKAGRDQIESDITQLEDGAPDLADAITAAALRLRDDWPEIEKNKLRVQETEEFINEFLRLKMTVMDFDDWRQDCYEKERIFPSAHQIAMSLVCMCHRSEELIAPTIRVIDELKNGGLRSDSPQLKFEAEMAPFCTPVVTGYLTSQIVHPHEAPMKSCWTGAKNELTLFGEHFNMDSRDLRMIFTFPDEKKTKQVFEMSKHPSTKLGEDNRLYQILQRYPRELFFK